MYSRFSDLDLKPNCLLRVAFSDRLDLKRRYGSRAPRTSR